MDGAEGRITDPVLQGGESRAEPEAARVGRLIKLVERVDLAPGQIRIDLDRDKTAALLSNGDLPRGALAIEASFQLRKRGVETKLVFEAAGARTVDHTLLLNIAKAHAWFGMLVEGRTYAEIAATERTSKRRVQQMVDLAFLAPDLVRMIVEGRQPLGFTSDWALRHDLPANWTAQRALIATL